MDISCDLNSINNTQLCKMMLIYNSLESGWTVKKRNLSYIFTKNHEGKKEIFSEDYLKRFLKENFDIEKLLSINDR